MLQIKRKSGVFHSNKVLKFVSRPAQNKDKPEFKAYPGDIISTMVIPGGGRNDDQWEVISGKVEDGFEDIVADDGTEVGRREKIKNDGETPSPDELKSSGLYTDMTTKHDGDVKNFINNETGEMFILHPDEKVENISHDDAEKPFIRESTEDPKKFDVINPKTGDPINTKPLTKLQAEKLM